MRLYVEEYNVGEYFSYDFSSRHSSTQPQELGEAISRFVRNTEVNKGISLELMGMSDYMNSGEVRCVFKVVYKY